MTHTILITGASRGIGLELVKQYAQEGWHVLACCRNPENARELSGLAKQHGHVQILPLDVTDQFAINRLATQLADQPIDILLNNAGVSTDQDLLGEVTADDWLRVVATNGLAPLMVSQAFVSQVEKSEKKIIAVMSSRMGSIADNTLGGSYAYRASKAAANSGVVSMAIDLKPRGIKVVTFHPGWVQTEMGGEGALIDTKTSVEGLRDVLSKLTQAQSGSFLTYDGKTLPW